VSGFLQLIVRVYSLGIFAAKSVVYLFKTQRTPNSVVFLFQVRKRAIFTRFLIRFCDNKLQFWPGRLHILNKRGQNCPFWQPFFKAIETFSSCFDPELFRYRKVCDFVSSVVFFTCILFSDPLSPVPLSPVSCFLSHFLCSPVPHSLSPVSPVFCLMSFVLVSLSLSLVSCSFVTYLTSLFPVSRPLSLFSHPLSSVPCPVLYALSPILFSLSPVFIP
jgi:hypothetical protein